MIHAAAVPPEEPSTLPRPAFDASAPLQFVINGKAGSSDSDATHEAITSELRSAGRTGRVWFAGHGELERVSRDAAAQARSEDSAVVAVGGDGTINTVAQVAHATGCTMGVIPEGTFNFFAREHGAPTEIAEALRWLLMARPEPAQVSAINERLFLVNASLGVYPELLQDRERWQARFGRSRVISLGAAIATLLRAQRPLRLRVAWEKQQRELRTLTLFVGNNRLQLEKLGLVDTAAPEGSETARLTAVILKPIGAVAMLGLMLRGAMGQLGSSSGVEHFPCHELVMEPASALRGRTVKVAFDGEVAWMRSPIVIRVLPTPLWLLKTPRSIDS
ncbi:diacylglycerol kinase family protein [Gemmatimonas sp.]|uniref:diacylglycerol/lipid kinase family protein n=1 Tax=Gemmatimonas sp. TaxID=1962908 RepID=UPI00286E6506|nr:diacylglycerol kinase family protein [Gemmatimonas sp.]